MNLPDVGKSSAYNVSIRPVDGEDLGSLVEALRRAMQAETGVKVQKGGAVRLAILEAARRRGLIGVTASEPPRDRLEHPEHEA